MSRRGARQRLWTTSVLWISLWKGPTVMPKSRSKRRRYVPPPRPKPKRSAPWVGPTIVVSLVVGIVYILLFYMQILPPVLDNLNNFNLAIGFVPLIFGLILATRWT
jgi:Cell division protein CrgA